MSFSVFMAIFTLSFAMSISPGPVNVLIISSGINHGFKATFSFISGATIGFTLLLIIIAFGLVQNIQKLDSFMIYLKIIGALFMLYMAFKVATSSQAIELEQKEAKTLRFHEGFLLQWLNPKAWIACISAVSIFSSTETILTTLIITYFVVCYMCLSFWGVLGEKATRFLNSSIRLRLFNVLMGTFLVFSALSIVLFEG